MVFGGGKSIFGIDKSMSTNAATAVPASSGNYVMCVRAVQKGQFVVDVGPTRFLVVPDDVAASPTQAVSATAWYKAVIAAAEWKNAAGEDRGDILIVVHGFNDTQGDVMQRHQLIKVGLNNIGFKGVVVSFDWPSDDSALAYLPDRHRAKDTAMQLVSDGISHLSGVQTPDCMINVHVLAHSTGAYVIREAFDDADDSALKNSAWNVSQLMFIAGDVSSASMAADNPGSKSIYNHCIRLTNYSNRHDAVLDISNVKRVGLAPRVGRIGLPANAPAVAVNVDCSDYYLQLSANTAIIAADMKDGQIIGAESHSWYFGNAIFTRDMFLTLIGTDRNSMPTRSKAPDGSLILHR